MKQEEFEQLAELVKSRVAYAGSLGTLTVSRLGEIPVAVYAHFGGTEYLILSPDGTWRLGK